MKKHKKKKHKKLSKEVKQAIDEMISLELNNTDILYLIESIFEKKRKLYEELVNKKEGFENIELNRYDKIEEKLRNMIKY